jgi:cellulose synthase/poly-beta-1,6-N-acetylglucosamine synthase-like glycosyltransferase
MGFRSVYHYRLILPADFPMTILCLICLLILAAYTYLIRRYDQGWFRLPEFEPDGDPLSGKNQISVIIPARNEEKRIAGCLR